MRVGLADFKKQYAALKDEMDAAVAGVLETGGYILGPNVEALEEEIAAYSGAKYGVGVNSGTDALLLSLLVHGIQPGDEVITSPFTFVATAEAIALVGARPVFADIDPRTFNLCPEATANAITPRTRAIMPVDLFGQMADRTAFVELAEQHGLTLIWDAAQAIGSTFDGKPLGGFPGSATLSFYPTKNLGAYGDGGMVLTNDEKVRDNLRQYRFHGSGGGYYYKKIGYCSRLDAMQAAVLRVKLKHLDGWTAARQRNADRYRELLTDACVTLPYVAPNIGAGHTYHQFTVRAPQRNALQAHLKANGIDSGIYYPLSLHLQEAYAFLGYRVGDFPVSERVTEEVLSLPIHPDLTDEQIGYVAEQIYAFDRLPAAV